MPTPKYLYEIRIGERGTRGGGSFTVQVEAEDSTKALRMIGGQYPGVNKWAPDAGDPYECLGGPTVVR